MAQTLLMFGIISHKNIYNSYQKFPSQTTSQRFFKSIFYWAKLCFHQNHQHSSLTLMGVQLGQNPTHEVLFTKCRVLMPISLQTYEIMWHVPGKANSGLSRNTEPQVRACSNSAEIICSCE